MTLDRGEWLLHGKPDNAAQYAESLTRLRGNIGEHYVYFLWVESGFVKVGYARSSDNNPKEWREYTSYGPWMRCQSVLRSVGLKEGRILGLEKCGCKVIYKAGGPNGIYSVCRREEKIHRAWEHWWTPPPDQKYGSEWFLPPPAAIERFLKKPEIPDGVLGYYKTSRVWAS